jgi:hypothetical protein
MMPGGMGGSMPPSGMPGGGMPGGTPPGAGMPQAGMAGGSGGFMPPGGMAGGAMPPAGFNPPGGVAGGFPPGGAMPQGGSGGFMPPGMGLPGMNPQGQADAKKGKDGKYVLYSQDKIVFVSLNLSLPDAVSQRIFQTLELGVVLARGYAEVSDPHPRIHELAAAIQAYVKDKNGTFPRGALRRSLSSERNLDWRPDQRLSWLAVVKDYLPGGDYTRLEIKEAEGWNEGNNLRIAQVPVPQFLSPVKSSNPLWYYIRYPYEGEKFFAATHFVGVAGVGLDAAYYRSDDPAVAKKLGIFGYDRETKVADVKDGLESTIVALQLSPEYAKPWLAGGGSTVRGISEEADCVQSFVCAEYQGKKGTFAIMADGRVRFIPADIAPDTFRAMCTIAGGETIRNLDEIAPVVEGDEGPALKTAPPPVPPAAQAPPPAAAPPPAVAAKPTDNDLKRIVLAYHNHLDAARKAPARAEDLAPFFENDTRLLAMLKNEDIVFFYNVGITQMTAGTSNTVLAYVKDVPAKGGLVGMADGSVRTMSAEEFAKATLAGKR